MIKFMSIICIVLFAISPYLHGEEIYFEEYKSLNPEIDLLSDGNAGNMGRKLLLFPQRASFNKIEYAYIYDVTTNRAEKMPSEQAGLIPYTRIIYFWDPHTKINYGYVRSIPEKNTNGWYTLELGNNDRLMLSLQSRDEYWAYYSPPYNKISESRILVSKYSGYMRHRPLERDSEFSVFDIDTGEKIWSYPITLNALHANLYWICGPWLLIITTPHIAGVWKTDTILNYETNEEVSFAPESIIGYGDGVILTSLQTDKGFVGITIWTADKEILYCDKDFPLTGMMGEPRNYFSGQHAINFSYYDFPYIYINMLKIYNIGLPYITLIMNLKDKKTYISPLTDQTYYLHGIFESD
jgi:hypothetical protein